MEGLTVQPLGLAGAGLCQMGLVPCSHMGGVLSAGTLGFGGVTLLSLAEWLDSFPWGPGVD